MRGINTTGPLLTYFTICHTPTPIPAAPQVPTMVPTRTGTNSSLKGCSPWFEPTLVEFATVAIGAAGMPSGMGAPSTGVEALSGVESAVGVLTVLGEGGSALSGTGSMIGVLRGAGSAIGCGNGGSTCGAAIG